MTYEDIEALDPAERKALCGQICNQFQHAFHPTTGLAYVDGLYDQDALCAVARQLHAFFTEGKAADLSAFEEVIAKSEVLYEEGVGDPEKTLDLEILFHRTECLRHLMLVKNRQESADSHADGRDEVYDIYRAERLFEKSRHLNPNYVLDDRLYFIDKKHTSFLMRAIKAAEDFIAEEQIDYSLRGKHIEYVETNFHGVRAIGVYFYKTEITPENWMTHSTQDLSDCWLCVMFEKSSGKLMRVMLQK